MPRHEINWGFKRQFSPFIKVPVTHVLALHEQPYKQADLNSVHVLIFQHVWGHETTVSFCNVCMLTIACSVKRLHIKVSKMSMLLSLMMPTKPDELMPDVCLLGA